jgi:hypothetical protein
MAFGDQVRYGVGDEIERNGLPERKAQRPFAADVRRDARLKRVVAVRKRDRR